MYCIPRALFTIMYPNKLRTDPAASARWRRRSRSRQTSRRLLSELLELALVPELELEVLRRKGCLRQQVHLERMDSPTELERQRETLLLHRHQSRRNHLQSHRLRASVVARAPSHSGLASFGSSVASSPGSAGASAAAARAWLGSAAPARSLGSSAPFAASSGRSAASAPSWGSAACSAPATTSSSCLLLHQRQTQVG